MTIATNAPARNPFFDYLVLPRHLIDQPYFTKKREGISALDAVVRVALSVRLKDNCTVKRLQTDKLTLKGMAADFGWTVKAVRYFLEKCQKMQIFGYQVGHKKGTAKGTSHCVITYIYQQLLEEEWERKAQLRAHVGHSRGDEESNKEYKKEDSSLRSESSNAASDEDDDWPMSKPQGATAEPPPPAEPASGAAPSSKKESAARAKRPAAKLVAIAPDWRPSAKTLAWVKTRGVSDSRIAQLIEEFIMYWEEDGKKRKSWDATFRNRISYLSDKGQLFSKKEKEYADDEPVYNMRGERVWAHQ